MSKYALIITYGAYAVVGGPMPSMNHVRAVTVGELLAPILPGSYFLSEHEANIHILEIFEYFLTNDTIVNRGRLC